MKLHIHIFLLIFGFQSCNSTKNLNSKFNTNQIIIYQDGKENQIDTGEQEFTMNRQDFSIRFFNKKYNSETKEHHAVQIAALTDKGQFQNINEGMKKSETECFSLGSGMASSREGYESIIISNSGHHYLPYQSEEGKRVNLIGEKGDLFKFEFSINSVYQNKKRIMLKDESIQEIYLAILIDRNLNGVIDKKELTKLTLKLK